MVPARLVFTGGVVVPPVEPEPLPVEDPELPVPEEDPEEDPEDVGFFVAWVFFPGFFGAALGVLLAVGDAIGVGAVTAG